MTQIALTPAELELIKQTRAAEEAKKAAEEAKEQEWLNRQIASEESNIAKYMRMAQMKKEFLTAQFNKLVAVYPDWELQTFDGEHIASVDVYREGGKKVRLWEKKYNLSVTQINHKTDKSFVIRSWDGKTMEAIGSYSSRKYKNAVTIGRVVAEKIEEEKRRRETIERVKNEKEIVREALNKMFPAAKGIDVARYRDCDAHIETNSGITIYLKCDVKDGDVSVTVSKIYASWWKMTPEQSSELITKIASL